MWGSKAQSVSTWRNHNCSVWHASWVKFSCHVDHLRAPHGLSSCAPKILMCEEFVCWERHSVWNTAFKKRCGVCRYLRGTNREKKLVNCSRHEAFNHDNPLLSLGFYVFPSSVVRWDHWACFYETFTKQNGPHKLVQLDLLCRVMSFVWAFSRTHWIENAWKNMILCVECDWNWNWKIVIWDVNVDVLLISCILRLGDIHTRFET